MTVHPLVLALLSASAPTGEADTPRALIMPGAAQLPASPAMPESIPTAHARLPDRPQPAGAAWMLSAEAVTRAPVDAGGQIMLESPYRVRLGVGYGWVPTTYSGLLMGIASSASGNTQVASLLTHTSLRGRTFRTAIGVRPLAGAGLHLDVGYARVSLDGSLDLGASGTPSLASQGGTFEVHSTMDAWSVEIGSQIEGWGLVLGFAFGLMRISTAHTTMTGPDVALNPTLASAAQQTDAALQTYGYVPTLTLRLGFDVLSLRPWMRTSDRL